MNATIELLSNESQTLSEDDLYERLAAATFKGAGQRSRQSLIDLGRAWFRENSENLRAEICAAAIEGPLSSDAITVVAAWASVLSASSPLNLTIIQACYGAALLARQYTVNSICSDITR